MIQYAIIQGNARFVADEVNKALQIGWQCQGGVAILLTRQAGETELMHMFAQALTRELQ